MPAFLQITVWKWGCLSQKFILSSSQGVVPSNDKISLFAIYQDESIYGLFVFHVKYKLHSFPCWETPYFEEQFFYFSPNSVWLSIVIAAGDWWSSVNMGFGDCGVGSHFLELRYFCFFSFVCVFLFWKPTCVTVFSRMIL